MSAPLIPYGRQNISEEDIAAVVEVLRSPWLTQGPSVPAFEKALAAAVGARHAVAVNSATSALHLSCLALGLCPGDRLWTSPITFVASANCGRYCGAEIDFVDIDPVTGLLSLEALERKLVQAAESGTLPKIDRSCSFGWYKLSDAGTRLTRASLRHPHCRRWQPCRRRQLSRGACWGLCSQ